MYVKVRNIFIALSLLSLLALFIIPTLVIKRTGEEVSRRAEEVIALLEAEDTDAAGRKATELHSYFHDKTGPLGYFLNHSCVEAVDVALASAEKQVQIGDVEGAIISLVAASHAMDILVHTEVFSFGNIL